MSGGDSPNQISHRAMAVLMTDEVMTEFTFAGRKGKPAFKTTAVFQCVCGKSSLPPLPITSPAVRD